MNENTNQLLLTYVVPCYNAERYVLKCLDSIYTCGLPENQYEVLCINDCSTDNTASILEQYNRLHTNLRVINHKNNKGWGGSRNTGIREAKGRYLWFVDSDDTICGNVVKALETAVSQDVDVLCFNYCRTNGDGKELSKHLVFDDSPTNNGLEFAKVSFSGGIVLHMGYVWRFLYRTEYIRNQSFYFPEHVCWEDTVFMPRSIIEANRVCAISDVLYAYRVNPNSITNVFTNAYPAKLIFEFAFCAGSDLLRYSDELDDNMLKTSLQNAAIHKYINGFSVHLFRTSRKEQKLFLRMVTKRRDEVAPLKKHMTKLNRLFLVPGFGALLVDCGSLLYRLKHWRK